MNADTHEKLLNEALLDFARRIALKPASHETRAATWCAPEYDDLAEWWTDAVEEARSILSIDKRDIASICKG